MGFEPTTPNLGELVKSIAYADWVYQRYPNRLTANGLLTYARRFYFAYHEVSKISEIPLSIRANVIKALVCLSKYLGDYEIFKLGLKSHGIKWVSGDAFSSFLNITNNNHAEVKLWYKEATSRLPKNEALYLKYCLVSGMRAREALRSFNRIIALANENRLNEYYNSNTQILEHFRYPDNLRNTKNCFISIASKELIAEIAQSKSISYTMIRRHLYRAKLPLMIKPLRSLFATFLHSKVPSETIDILQGRIPKSVFAKNYLKLNLTELSNQILAITETLETDL